MITERDIALSLFGAHEMLNAIRAVPFRAERIRGARVGVAPGVDAQFASASRNRTTVYDPRGADVIETLREAGRVYAEAGVGHWFAELGPGVRGEEIAGVMREFGAKVVPWVRYPVMARAPGEMAAVKTSLEIRRVGVEEVRAHAAEIDAIWEKPGASAATLNAAGRPGYHVVLSLAETDGGKKAVGMGMLLVGGGSDGAPRVGYLASGGTNAEYRRRGGQSAIIAERVRIAREVGCDVCVSEAVTAVATSESNLLRAGFGLVWDWVVMEVGEYGGKGG